MVGSLLNFRDIHDVMAQAAIEPDLRGALAGSERYLNAH
jgi:hypothetical protein